MIALLTAQLRQIYRKSYWISRNAGPLWRYRHLRGIIFFGGNSLGDDLLCTAVARQISAQLGGPLGMMTRFPALFDGNPHVSTCLPVDLGLLTSLRHAGKKIWQPAYVDERCSPYLPSPPRPHVIAQMCRTCAVSAPVDLAPEIYAPAQPEAPLYQLARGALVIQSSNRGAAKHYPGKEWGAERFQAVVDQLRTTHRFIQVGSTSDTPLREVTDLRGRTPLAELIQLFHGMDGFVGLEGFYMHLARSVKKKSVIVYGGRVSPASFGYPENINLTSRLSESAQGRAELDHEEAEAMDAIDPTSVISAARQLSPTPQIKLS